jgi:hypothetical protein
VSNFDSCLNLVCTMGTCPFDCTDPVSTLSFLAEGYRLTETGLALECRDSAFSMFSEGGSKVGLTTVVFSSTGDWTSSKSREGLSSAGGGCGLVSWTRFLRADVCSSPSLRVRRGDLLARSNFFYLIFFYRFTRLVSTYISKSSS